MVVLQTLGGDTTWPSQKRIQKTNTEKTQKNIGEYGTHNKNNKIKSHRTATLLSQSTLPIPSLIG